MVIRNIHSESGSLGVMVRSTKPASALGSQVYIFYYLDMEPEQGHWYRI